MLWGRIYHPPHSFINVKIAMEDKFDFLFSKIKEMREEFGPEKSKNPKEVISNAVKGWGMFCGFVDAFTRALENEH